jgi:multicomponent Na+:H+ antiporter subunit D
METAAAAVTALIFAPLLGALAAWLIGRAWLADALAVLTAAGLIVATALLSREAIAADGLRIALGGHDAPLGIELAVDGLTLIMLWLAQIIALMIAIYVRGWAETTSPATALLFRVVWMLLWSGLNALFLSADLFNLYVTLEITTLAGVSMVAVAGSASALAAAMRYLQFALVGSIFYLLGVALIYAETGVLAMGLLQATGQASVAGYAALGTMTLGLLLKAALFPLHGWLPDGHSSAPSPASALLSALVVKAAAYLLLRIWIGPFGMTWTPMLAQAIGALGLAGILYASLQALRQTRLKLVIAYSTVAQLGYLLLLVPLASVLAWQGVLYHALAHGLAKAAMFLAAGNVIRAIGNDRLENLTGMDRVLSGNLLVIAIAGISLAGLPPSGGFVGKWWIVLAALEAGQWWWAAGVAAGGLLAAAYVFRILQHGMSSPDSYAEAPLRFARDLPRTMLWPPYLLALAALALGFTGDLIAPLMNVGLPARIAP